MITDTSEFYLGLMDHPGWEQGHTIWGKVLDMDLVEKIAEDSRWEEFVHPDFGTHMRMMKPVLKFQPRFELVDQEL
eukprot:gene24781-10422_t